MTSPDGGVLLDTCAAIWMMNGNLPAKVFNHVIAAGSQGMIFVSPVSAWEIGMLSRPKPGRGPAPEFVPDALAWFGILMRAPGVCRAELTPQIAIGASYLPGDIHGDPADRLLLATARELDIPIVTSDRKMIAYGTAGHVGVIAC